MEREKYNRMVSPKNTSDILLQKRAEIISNSTRLLRIFIHYRNIFTHKNPNKEWDFENVFDTTHYDFFISNVSVEIKNKIKGISYGDLYSNDPNGMIMKTVHDPLITLDSSLDYFLKYSNLALMSEKFEVPYRIRKNGLFIAYRVMRKYEALDFDFDPRGKIPKTIDHIINSMVFWQKVFITGHEFSHYLLGHLNNSNLKEMKLFMSSEEVTTFKVYNYMQQQEFDADIHALKLLEMSNVNYNDYGDSVIMWFCNLSIFEGALEYTNPKIGYRRSTHPTGKERLKNVFDFLKTKLNLDDDYYISLLTVIDKYVKVMHTELALSIDELEKYGSLYLDKPNTKWRGRERIDRVDY